MSPMSNRAMWSPLTWPAHTVESAPLPVRDAWDAVQKSAQRATQAGAAHRHAVTRLQAADRDDQAAAKTSISRGEPVPPSVQPEREKALADADRYRRASEALAVTDERALYAAAEKHRAEWLAGVTPEVDTAAEHAIVALDTAEEAFQRLSDLAAVHEWLEFGDLRQQPRGHVPLAAREAVREGRLAALQLTPAVVQQAREERARAEAEAAANAPRSFAGIVLDGPGRRALAG